MEKQDNTNIKISENTGSLTWKLDNDTLTISGNGTMMQDDSDCNWVSYKNSITTVIIEDGITNIEEWAFYNCEKLTSVSIPNSVTTIGEIGRASCRERV